MSRRRELLAYVLLPVATVLPALVRGHHVGDGADAYGTAWFYAWIRTCVERLGDPSHTDLFFWPVGKDVFAHTGNNFVDAVLSVPFQWLLGPVVYQPIFCAFLLLGNALAFRPLAGLLLGEGGRAIAATLLWQANPYLLFELTAGRPTQAMGWWIPLALYFLVRTWRAPTARDAVCLGVAVALAGWTYWYAAYALALAIVPLAAGELRDPARRRELLRAWALAAAVALAIASPAVARMALLRATEAGAVLTAAGRADSIFALPMGLGNNVPAGLHGLWQMETEGIPLALQPAWLVPTVYACSRSPLARRWKVALAGVLAISLGPSLASAWTGSVVNVPYMVLYRCLPFFDRLWFPYRLVVPGFAIAALLIASTLPSGRRGAAWTAALLAVGLGGQVRWSAWPPTTRDPRPPELIEHLREAPGAVLYLPSGIQHDGIAWQATDQLPQVGGMAEGARFFWPPGRDLPLASPVVRALDRASRGRPPGLARIPEAVAALQARGLNWIILRRDLVSHPGVSEADRAAAAASSVALLTEALARDPSAVSGPLVAWELSGAWVAGGDLGATKARLSEPSWTSLQSPAWFQAAAQRRR